MRELFFCSLVLIMLSGCAAKDVLTSPTPESPPALQPYAPQPGDELLVQGDVYLDHMDLLIMESFPIQVNLQLVGNLPTPCHHLRVSVAEPDADNRIDLEVFSVADPTLVCTQVLEPFDTAVPLGSFPSGHYSVWVNGQLVGEFDA